MQKTKIFAAVMSAALFFAACQKEQAQVETTNQMPDNQIVALEPTDSWQGNPHKTFVVGLLQLANNNSFKTVLNDKIAEQFDGDDNVLLKDLLVACADNSINFSNAIKQGVLNYNNNLPAIEHPYTQYIASSDDNTIMGWINNGLSFGGQNYFLHVYIPFFDKVELESNPTIVFGLNETETTLGYKRNADNSISALVVDEDYAQNNLVWVVAINESVNSNGVIERPAQPDEDAAHPSQQASHRAPGDRYVELSQVYITDKNESWIRGKADITYASVKFNPNNCSWVMLDVSSGANSIIKLGNNDLQTWKSVSEPRKVIARPNSTAPTPFVDGQTLSILLFEYDAVSQSTQNTQTCFLGASAITLRYNSRDVSYGIRDIPASAMMSSTYVTHPSVWWGTQRNGLRLDYRREP